MPCMLHQEPRSDRPITSLDIGLGVFAVDPRFDDELLKVSADSLGVPLDSQERLAVAHEEPSVTASASAVIDAEVLGRVGRPERKVVANSPRAQSK